MNTRRMVQFFFFVGLFGCASSGVVNSQQEAPPVGIVTVGAPTFQVGNFWRYKYLNRDGGFSSTIRDVVSDKVIISPEIVWSKEGNLISGFGTVTGKAVTYNPYIPRLQFPLWVGKEWRVSYAASWDSGSEYATLHVKVVGKEKVVVPAGTFEALGLEMRFSSGNQESCWYAEEVKRFIKCKYSDPLRDYELVSFRLRPLF